MCVCVCVCMCVCVCVCVCVVCVCVYLYARVYNRCLCFAPELRHTASSREAASVAPIIGHLVHCRLILLFTKYPALFTRPCCVLDVFTQQIIQDSKF